LEFSKLKNNNNNNKLILLSHTLDGKRFFINRNKLSRESTTRKKSFRLVDAGLFRSEKNRISIGFPGRYDFIENIKDASNHARVTTRRQAQQKMV